MTTSALLLGSIGVLVDTSDMQRRAFNTAFEEHDLNWHWDAAKYAELLRTPGGKARLAAYAAAQGHDVDVAAVYETKVELFDYALRRAQVGLRPGIGDLIAEAQRLGLLLGFVTSTNARQVAAVLEALRDEVTPSVFDFIGHGALVPRSKPSPHIYSEALRVLDVTAGDALAIEDTPESARSAISAGIPTWAYPSVAEGRVFGRVIGTGIPRLDLLRAPELLAAAG
ncbi:MAG: HAD hydrolase-like protein [Pseudomonadota bacterium]